MKTSTLLLGLLSIVGAATSGYAQNLSASAPSTGTLFEANFENGLPWSGNKPASVGTINLAGSAQPSLGLSSASRISSGPFAIENTETHLGKLTLALSLSANAARPVKVFVESFNGKKQRTGGLETTVYPAAPNFYQRYALDLSNFKPSGAGEFVPNAPFLGFSVSIGGAHWIGIAKPEIRIDNVHFAKPAYYVSPNGNDNNDGRTEKTAFATPQKAVDAAGPGDIIAVMNGTYLPLGAQEGIVNITKAGMPGAWITLKNYPGHKPLFFLTKAWVAIRIWDRKVPGASPSTPVAAAVPSYLEVRGIHIRGEGDVAKTKYPDKMVMATPETNGNGISVSWSGKSTEPYPHHLRFADNIVEHCPGAGIGPGGADWVTIENNIIRNNCWTTIYGTSGISMNHGSNFDGTSGGYRVLIRDNETSGNRTFEIWKQIGKISDGNGIIIDVNQDSKLPEEQRFSGRTLIANNLTFNNGGSGIHAFKSKRVDIVNNTVYLNSASPELVWGQMFVQQSEDVRMVNNIVVAPPDQPVNTVGMNGNDQNSKNIVRANNLYFGGAIAPIMGEGDIIADPQFVNASTDANIANFRLKPGSPAVGRGRGETFTPILDLDGKPRGATPTIGAYERSSAASALAMQAPVRATVLQDNTSNTSPTTQRVAPVAAQLTSGTLLQLDFNGANPWPQAAADVMPSTPIDVLTSIETRPIGTVDSAGSSTPSGGLLLKTEVGAVNLPWIATYTSGLMPVNNGGTNGGELTMGFHLSASSARPVIVRLESFNANKNRTGGLETTVTPAAANAFEKVALKLSAMQASGSGQFNPADPYVQFTFELRNPAWPDKALHELRLDNVRYARSSS